MTESWWSKATVFARFAFSFDILSLILAFYLVFYKVKAHRIFTARGRSRWWVDDQYRLRVILVWFVLINRLCQLPVQLIFLVQEVDDYARDDKGLGSARLWLYLTFLCTLYVNLTYIYFVTVDRYAAVRQVEGGTWMYTFIKSSKLILHIMLVYVIFGYCLEYVPIITMGRNLRNSIAFVREAVNIRLLSELVGLIYGILADYVFTVILIWGAVMDMSDPCDAASEYESNDDQKLLFQMKSLRIKQQKRIVAMKMSLYFFTIFIMDVITFIFRFTVVRTNYDFEQFIVIIGSWISIRVACVFELLDMFLKQLKEAEYIRLSGVKIPQTNIQRTAELNEPLSHMDHSTLEDSETMEIPSDPSQPTVSICQNSNLIDFIDDLESSPSTIKTIDP